MILCLELGLIWLIYLGFGWLAKHEMPLWLSTFIVIGVDRLTTAVAEFAKHRRTRLMP